MAGAAVSAAKPVKVRATIDVDLGTGELTVSYKRLDGRKEPINFTALLAHVRRVFAEPA